MAPAGRERPDGQGRAGVHGQQEHARRHAVRPELLERSHPLVAVVRRHPDVEHDRVGLRVRLQGRVQAGDVGRHGDHVAAARHEQLPDPLAHQHRVVDHDDPRSLEAHGSASRDGGVDESCPGVRTRGRGSRRAPRSGRPGPADPVPEPSSRAPPCPSSRHRHAHGVAEPHLERGPGPRRSAWPRWSGTRQPRSRPSPRCSRPARRRRSRARSWGPVSAARARARRSRGVPWTKAVGAIPLARLRSSASALLSSAWASSRTPASASASPSPARVAARLSLIPVEMSSCWAPSWRSRSIRRRVSSDAERMRARESRTCSRLACSSAVSRRFSAASSRASATDSRTLGSRLSSRSESTTAIGRPPASTGRTSGRAPRPADRGGRGRRRWRGPTTRPPRAGRRSPGPPASRSRDGWCSSRAASEEVRHVRPARPLGGERDGVQDRHQHQSTRPARPPPRRDSALAERRVTATGEQAAGERGVARQERPRGGPARTAPGGEEDRQAGEDDACLGRGECVGESQVRRTRQVEDSDGVVDATAPVPGGRVVRRGAGRHAQHTESDGQPHRHPTHATDQTAVGVHEGDDHDGGSEADAERLDGHPGRRVLLEAGAQPRGGGRDARQAQGRRTEHRHDPAASPRWPHLRTPGPGGRPAPARGTRRTAPGSRTRPPRRRRWPRRGPRARARGQARSGARRGCPPWAHHRPVGRRRGWGDLPRHRGSDPDSVTTPRAPSVSVHVEPGSARERCGGIRLARGHA